jgi:hypothetical protein
MGFLFFIPHKKIFQIRRFSMSQTEDLLMEIKENVDYIVASISDLNEVPGLLEQILEELKAIRKE